MIDGKAIAAQITERLRERIARRHSGRRSPGLAAILVGEDPASMVYVERKLAACESVGIVSRAKRLPTDADLTTVLAAVEHLNRDPTIDGFLVQQPLPEGIDRRAVVEAVDPDKDVDCLHPTNQGRLLVGDACLEPCTPAGILAMLGAVGVSPEGANVVIAGRSDIVGTPLAVMLSRKAPGRNATVTLCHSRTRDMERHTVRADILVAAIGVPGHIRAEGVKPGAAVIDVGVNRVIDPSRKRGYRLVGDVAFEGVAQKASWITPVPGGVGPMTITMVLENAVRCYERREGPLP